MTDKEKHTHDFEKPIVYIDMDNVLVDFQSGIDKLTFANKQKYVGNYHKVPHIFRLMKPIDGAIDAVHQLEKTACYLSDLFFRIIKTLIKARI